MAAVLMGIWPQTLTHIIACPISNQSYLITTRPTLVDSYTPTGGNEKCIVVRGPLNVAVSGRASKITWNRLPHKQCRGVQNVSALCGSMLSCLKIL